MVSTLVPGWFWKHGCYLQVRNYSVLHLSLTLVHRVASNGWTVVLRLLTVHCFGIVGIRSMLLHIKD